MSLYRVSVHVVDDDTTITWSVRATSEADAEARVQRMCGILARANGGLYVVKAAVAS